MRKQIIPILLLILFSLKVQSQNNATSFMKIQRIPDAITVQTSNSTLQLTYKNTKWTGDGIEVITILKNNGLEIELTAPSTPIKNLYIKWSISPENDMRYLGDAWERAYGNLQWLPLDTTRVMPWYLDRKSVV